MIGFYVIMIAVLLMSATAGYTIFTSASTGSALSLAYQNSARIEQNTIALNHVVSLNSEGNFAVPLGILSDPEDPESRMILPSWVSPSSATSWGVRYGYCPFAPVDWSGPAGTPADVYDSAGFSHRVETTNAIVSQGTARAYVTAGDKRTAHVSDAASAPDVLAFIISPTNNALEVPACGDVYWTGYGWVIDGDVRGSVRALTPDALTHSLSEAPRLLKRYVAPSGTGTGISSTDPTSLAMALAEWTHLLPARMTINLSGGIQDHLIDLSTTDLGSGPGNVVPNAAGQGRSLHLVGESGVIVSAASGSGVLAIPVDMTVSGVDFGPNLGFDVGPGVRLVLRDGASVPSLRSRGGHIVMSSGASILAQSIGSPVILEGGSMIIQGNATIDANGAGASAVHLDGAGFRIDGSLDVTTNAGLTLFTDSSRGMPTFGPAAAFTLNRDVQDLADYPDMMTGRIETRSLMAESLQTELLMLGLKTESNMCPDNTMNCAATCPEATRVVSGNCTAGAINVFLTGSGATEDGSGFTCDWSAAQGTGLTASNLQAPTANALCAPIE